MPDQAGDPPSIPLFSHHVEAKAMESLNVLILVHGGGDVPIHDSQLTQLRASLTRLVDCLFPVIGDYADFAGADSLDGSDYTHPIKVAALAVVIGREMGLRRSALINLAMAAALMNLGYLSLRLSILDEPRHLLEGEWEDHVHTHPDRSAALLSQSGLPDDCLRAIREHHECWNGSGFPDHLRGDAISRDARILAVADSYVSLRSLRAHRRAADADEALREIAGGSGTLFDPEVVDAFERVIAEYTGIMRPQSVTDARDEDPPRHPHIRAQTGAAPLAERTGADRRAAPRTPISIRPRRPAAIPPAAVSTMRAVPAWAPPPRALPKQPAPPRESARHHAQRHARRKPTLFAAGLYVDAAVRGRWASD